MDVATSLRVHQQTCHLSVFQTTQAAEYARFVVGSDPDVLEAFPCQELIRIEPRREPRDWVSRWQAAGGRLYGGRMIARKDDPVWTEISAFGTPFPPFDFGSGMGVVDVDREEAVALGLLSPESQVQSPQSGFNDQLEQSIANLDDQGRQDLRELFGDQVVIRGDKVAWQGNLVGELFDATQAWAAAGRPQAAKPKGISLGAAPARTIQLAQAAGVDVDLRGADLMLLPENLAHALAQHPDLGRVQIETIPHVWRNPDVVVPGNKPRSLELRKQIIGEQVVIGYQMWPQQKRVFVNTVYTRKAAS